MNLLLIVAGAAILYIIGYKTYGSFLSRKIYELDNSRKTPAEEIRDGLDYVPTSYKFLI